MGLTTAHMKNWLDKANETIQEKKEYLTELDQAIGDGDHGINISRGFAEAVKKTDGGGYAAPADLLKDWAMTLVSKVGGASGPLFGTAILKMSMKLKNVEEIRYSDLIDAFEEGLNGIIQRGHAEENQKTMLDVWKPAVRWLQEQDSFDPTAFKAVIKEAMEGTKEMKAVKGRASYLKERSIGHIDPGSASSYYVLAALADTIEEEGAAL